MFMNRYILEIKINIESREIKIMSKFDLAIKTLWGQRIFNPLFNLTKNLLLKNNVKNMILLLKGK